MDTQPNNAQVIADLARSQGDPRAAGIDGTPYIIIPNDAQLVDLERTLEKPVRPRARVELYTLESFVNYVAQHGNEDCTALFADLSPTTCKVTAILDYHESAGGKAGWREHTAVFAPVDGVEFKRWRDKNGQWFSQLAFAEWLQDNQLDVVAPPGAHLLEIATTLMAKKEVNFRRSEVLATGTAQFTYDEVLKAGGGATGQLEIPAMFVLDLPLHQGGQSRKLEARLRYKIEEGKLSFRYDLVALHKVIERTNAELLQMVQEMTEFVPFVGCVK